MFRFIALHPDRELGDRLSRHKEKVLSAAGPQLYLDHPPHLTVYLADFADDIHLLDNLAPLLESLPPIHIRAVGWHEFLGDSLTGLNTLVYSLDDDTITTLRRLQAAVIDRLAPLRLLESTTARYASRIASLTAQQRTSVETRGFPYTGDGWHPHFTVASIRPDVWDAAKSALVGDEPVGVFTCSALAEYTLETAMPKLTAVVPFSGEPKATAGSVPVR